MELPLWFQCAMEQRLDWVSVKIEQHPELRQYRAEEDVAWETLFAGKDKLHSTEFMDWEDKHHFRCALENEMLYLQGMRDGVQLVMSLLTDPLAEDVHQDKGTETPARPEGKT